LLGLFFTHLKNLEHSSMKIIALVCRILLGLMFVIFGANGLHPFMHMPQPVPGTPVGDWMIAMMGSGWMWAISGFQVIGGLLVLFGGTLPLGLCILCPITVNILLYHFCLTGGKGIGMGAFTGMLEIVLIWAYRANFSGIFTAKAAPVPRP
jgi:putative oxidoreductase